MPSRLFRLYIDESGSHSLKNLESIDQKYLGLVGVIIEREFLHNSFIPELQKIKWNHFEQEYIRDDIDRRTILHRQDIEWNRFCFKPFKNPDKRFRFDLELLQFLKNTEMQIIAVVLDKANHLAKYGQEALQQPYHHCLYEMIKRYCLFLHALDARGDMMAEGRGAVEDAELKLAYQEVFNNGHDGQGPGYFQTVLKSGKLDVRHKKENIYGLQLADLIAQDCTRGILHDRGIVDLPIQSLQTAILDVISDKYLTNPDTEELIGKVFT